MEHGFLKAPWEVLVRNFRAGHKPVAKEVEMLSTAVNQLIQRTLASGLSRNVDEGATSLIQSPSITTLQSRLTGLKRKLEQTRIADEHSIMRCQHRIAHVQARASGGDPPSVSLPPEAQMKLSAEGPRDCFENTKMEDVPSAEGEKTSSAQVTEQGMEAEDVHDACSIDDVMTSEVSSTERQSRWEKVRLDRALVDYMLREGMYDTAHKLAQSHGIEHIVDSDIFRESRVVIEALRRRDCKEGLRWCTENKRRLQKVDSKLEFRLRCQEFVELARARRKPDAINYMRKYLSVNCEGDQFLDIQRFMALLIFDPSTSCQPYKDMYGEHKWLELEMAFKHDNYRLHGLTRESTIEILVKAGLASLKTRKCGTEADRKPNCPTCVEPYLSLARLLPRSRHENSVLVCSISGEIMDENNPPMAMPQGNVYSWKALKRISDENNGIVIDPRTQEKARFDELRKCFIM